MGFDAILFLQSHNHTINYSAVILLNLHLPIIAGPALHHVLAYLFPISWRLHQYLLFPVKPDLMFGLENED